jgi:hypothetical protein
MREIFTRTEDNESVRIEVNLEAKEHKELNPYILSVFIKYDALNEDNDDELNEFFEIKESLIIALELDEKTVYVGNRLVGEWSEIYFYSQESKGLESKVAQILKPIKYINETNVVKDAQWEFFDYNIFPNDLELCLMQSQKIVEHMQDEGDRIEISREVEHYASFETPTQKQRFVEKAEQNGFTFKADIEDEDIKHGVALTKEHNLSDDDIKKTITQIHQYIKQENGEYELWSTTLED